MAPTYFEPRFASLVDIFQQSVERFGDRPLFGTKNGGTWRWMSYREFGRHTDEIRGGLRHVGVRPLDRVAIIANNRPEWAALAYAAYGLGATYVPMYESQHPDEWRYILKDAGVKALVVANDDLRQRVEAFADALPNLGHIITLGRSVSEKTYDQLRELGRLHPWDCEEVQPDDVAEFIYTSGTTGRPKGVQLTHRNLAGNVSALNEVFPIDPEDRSLSFLPWAHSFGQTVELMAMFSMGASMGIAESFPKIVENMAEVRPTLLFGVPRIFHRIYDGVLKRVGEGGRVRRALFDRALASATERRRFAEQHRRSGFVDFKHAVFDRLVFERLRARFGGRLKYAFSGGAAMSKEVAEFIDNLGILVYEGYGLTETSPVATCNWPGARKIGSVGKALPGIRIEIDKRAADDPKHGEVVIHGHNVMKGYHNLPDENGKVFTEDGGFRSGDLGYIDSEGFLFITGRLKEQYKMENGKYVVPAPLEEALRLSPYIANAVVFGANRPFNVALIVPEMEALKAWAAEHGVASRDDRLLSNGRVRALIQAELEARSSRFKGFERIKAFALVEEEFSVENGMLTPKLSVKRQKVMAKWGTRLDALYR